MKVARVALAATALLAAAACGSVSPTAPETPGIDGPSTSLGAFGSGSISSDPPSPVVPATYSVPVTD